MYEEIPYEEAIDAYRTWQEVTKRYRDMKGFFKFVGHNTFGKQYRTCRLPQHAIKRIRLINSPHGRTVIKIYLINEIDVEVF